MFCIDRAFLFPCERNDRSRIVSILKSLHKCLLVLLVFGCEDGFLCFRRSFHALPHSFRHEGDCGTCSNDRGFTLSVFHRGLGKCLYVGKVYFHGVVPPKKLNGLKVDKKQKRCRMCIFSSLTWPLPNRTWKHIPTSSL